MDVPGFEEVKLPTQMGNLKFKNLLIAPQLSREGFFSGHGTGGRLLEVLRSSDVYGQRGQEKPGMGKTGLAHTSMYLVSRQKNYRPK